MSARNRHATDQRKEDTEPWKGEHRDNMSTEYLASLKSHSFAPLPPPPRTHFDPARFQPIDEPDRHSQPRSHIAPTATQGNVQIGRPAPSRNSPRSSSRALPLTSLLHSEPSPPPASQKSSMISPLERMKISGGTFLADPAPTESYSKGNRNTRTRNEYFDPARDYYSRDIAPPRPQGSSISRTSWTSHSPISTSNAPADAPTDFGSGREFGVRTQSFDVSRYRLKILQHPKAARACGLGERDRRVIDPPPILQLFIKDFNPHNEDDVNNLSAQYNTVHCSLHEVVGPEEALGKDVTVIKNPSDEGQEIRRLMGSLCINPFLGTDSTVPERAPSSARIGTYYVFHDVSCRQHGRYRLVFKLIPIDPATLFEGGRVTTAAEVVSHVFEVFSAKDFPGMRESTPLTKELKRQGATVSVKKGSENKVNRKAQKKSAVDSPGGSTDLSEDETRSRSIPKPALVAAQYD